MGKGIAIIIPNADFSNSPLGKVTFENSNAEKAEELVVNYASKIGTSSYNVALTELVTSLYDLNVVDKLSIYPLLGTTLDAKGVNLLPQRQIHTGNTKDLSFASNAEVNDAGVAFNRTTESASPTYAFYNTEDFFAGIVYTPRTANSVRENVFCSLQIYAMGGFNDKLGLTLFESKALTTSFDESSFFKQHTIYGYADVDDSYITATSVVDGTVCVGAQAENKTTRGYVSTNRTLGIIGEGGVETQSLGGILSLLVVGNIEPTLRESVMGVLDRFISKVYK